MKEHGIPLAPTRQTVGPLRLASVEEIFEDMRETFDSIAQRAYQLFEANGRRFGRDTEDWFRAEKEFLHPVQVELTESPEVLGVKAEVPGFEAKDVEISLEPLRVTLAGNQAYRKEEKQETVLFSESRSNRFFRSIELPVEVDPERATATLKDGILELKISKAKPATVRKIQIESKAA